MPIIITPIIIMPIIIMAIIMAYIDGLLLWPVIIMAYYCGLLWDSSGCPMGFLWVPNGIPLGVQWDSPTLSGCDPSEKALSLPSSGCPMGFLLRALQSPRGHRGRATQRRASSPRASRRPLRRSEQTCPSLARRSWSKSMDFRTKIVRNRMKVIGKS